MDKTMIARRFRHDDIKLINTWYAAWKKPQLCQFDFPDIGFVVDGIGAGFIYQTDSSVCFVEGYISNPESDKLERDKAFDIITHSLLLVAKEHGFKAVLAYAQVPAVKKRAEKFLFNFKGSYDLYVKEV